MPKITFSDDGAGAKHAERMKREAKRMAAALIRAANGVSREILTKGRADIRSAGRFGKRWTQGLHADVEADKSGDAEIAVYHDVPYWRVFETGRVIHGKPLLWIPLSFAKDAQKVRARDFSGGLFRVDRKGSKAPLLLSIKTGEPKYFGKKSVKIPKKFHILEICRAAAKKLKSFYRVEIQKNEDA